MKVIASTGDKDVAVVYIVEFPGGRRVECVESVKPPLTRDDKWVLLVSTMFGCPVRCKMCDAGGLYLGKLSRQELLSQIDFLVRRRYSDGVIPAKQWKIQFARMGEPALNPAVLEVLEELPGLYQAPGLTPSISTVAPVGVHDFLDKMLEIKRKRYRGDFFQFQFSLHTTDEVLRNEIIPVRTWSFREMSEFGKRFFEAGDRKVTLNFALAQDTPVDTNVLLEYFPADTFLIKLTPLNPTYKAVENGLYSLIDPSVPEEHYEVVRDLRSAGYDVIVSIGEVEENLIGSNCGQYLRTHMEAAGELENGYRYEVESEEKRGSW